MTSEDTALVSWLKKSLADNAYENLRYLDTADEFSLFTPRKNTRDCTNANAKIFEDYENRRKWKCKNNFNKPTERFEYSPSKQRLLSALKNSVFITELHSGQKNTHKFHFNTSEEIQNARKLKRQRTAGEEASGMKQQRKNEENTETCLGAVNIPSAKAQDYENNEDQLLCDSFPLEPDVLLEIMNRSSDEMLQDETFLGFCNSLS